MASEKHSKVTPLQPAPEKEPAPELERKDIPVLPVRDTVLFPHAVLPLTVGRESSIQLINSLGEEKTILVVAQREARVDSPQPSDLYSIGTLATVHKVVKMPNQSLFVFTEGLQRAKLAEFTQVAPFLRADVDLVSDTEPESSPEIEALQRNVLTLFQQIVAGSPTLSDAWWILSRRRYPSFPLGISKKSWKRPTCLTVCRRSTSTWPRSWRSSSCATRSRRKFRIRCSNRSASTTCASR